MKRLLEAWPLLAWLTLVVVVAALLIGCDTTPQTKQVAPPERFAIVHEQANPIIYVVKDTQTGTCLVGRRNSTVPFTLVPKEVCEVKNP